LCTCPWRSLRDLILFLVSFCFLTMRWAVCPFLCFLLLQSSMPLETQSNESVSQNKTFINNLWVNYLRYFITLMEN
jgi:hypothetical protein